MATNAAGLATGALTRMSPATSVSGVPVSSAQAWAATNKSVIVWNARQLFFVKRADAEYLDLRTAYEQAVFVRWIGNRARQPEQCFDRIRRGRLVDNRVDIDRCTVGLPEPAHDGDATHDRVATEPGAGEGRNCLHK